MNDLWNRLRESHLVRALAVFFAGAWVALQVAAFSIEQFGAPGWTLKATVALLAIGLFVILATAWVRARVARRAAAGAAPSRLRFLTWRRAVEGGILAFALLFGLAGLWVVIQDRGRSFAPDEAHAEAAPGVAVLPFEASGAGLESWREGAIDLISTNLDGAAGLRAIDSRTVLARWSEMVPEGTRPDLETALGVAERTGARYALLGSAVALGSGIRLTADVYRVEGGRKLGTAQVEGAADSVYALVDRLSIEALRAIVGESGEFPRIELARVTTTSLPALRAYLEGESHLRRADFEPAVEAYQRAVAADSTFALAWRRLGESIGWLPPDKRPEQGPYFAARRAVRWIDRLPEREAIAVRAYHGYVHGAFRPILEPLRAAVRRFPDDPELLFLLAEIYVHMGEQVPVDDAETERTLQRVLELDPTYAVYYQHPIEFAFYRADSARALALLARYEALSVDNREARGYRLAADIAWGDAATRAAALAALDTTAVEALPIVELRHPRFAEERARLAELAGAGGSPMQAAFGALATGRLPAARETLDDLAPGMAAGLLYISHLLDVPLGDERLREMTRAAPDTVFPEVYYRALLAAEDGDRAAVAHEAAFARAWADTARSEGDSLDALQADASALALEGLLRHQQGDTAGALPMLLEAQRDLTGWGPLHDLNDILRIWIARAYLDLDRPAEALPWLDTFGVKEPWLYPHVALEMGAVYERLGRRDEARGRYETALAYWRNADPEMRPKVAEARAGIARLGIRPRG